MKNFRDLKVYNLNATASAQFSENELANYLKQYHQKITILDLRAEYHGFVDGQPISLKHLGITNPNNHSISYDLNNELDIITRDIKKNPSYFSQIANFSINNKSCQIITEELLAKKYHCNYQRIPLPDHHFPNQNQFNKILDLIKNIDQDFNQKIHVHCAAGRGRTGIFLVIYDIFKNHNNYSLEEIFQRQADLGSANLNDLKNENEWSDAEKNNINILQQFYYQLKQN